MYEGGIRVPFLVSGPGIEPGSVNRTPVTGLDILPTIADYAGYPDDLPITVDGGSLRAALGGGSAVARNTDFLIFHQAVGRKAQSAIRLGEWKLVKTWANDRRELFDLSEDIGETKDLAHAHPGQLSRLHSTLTQFLAKVDAEIRKTD